MVSIAGLGLACPAIFLFVTFVCFCNFSRCIRFSRKLMDIPIGLIINFHELKLTDGLTRMILPRARAVTTFM